jgi:amidohydrolase
MEMDRSEAREVVRDRVAQAHASLVGLSHWIHANPELAFEETLAAGWVAEWLTTAGFETRTGVAGLETAVSGTYGPGPLHVAICVEYDALPAVGHACGHNVICAASLGAGIALAGVADELGLRVTVLGTPAEEGGAGKAILLEGGAFDGVHAAMMVHPFPHEVLEPRVLAAQTLEISYEGREAHASAYPELGINAADALVIAQSAIGLLRQHLRPTDRVHGIVTKGGDAPNIVPAHTTARYMVRAETLEQLEEVREKVLRCFEAGALATGATLAVREQTAYAHMRHDHDIAAFYRANAEALGRSFPPVDPGAASFSTDMGNVSLSIPSIHPMVSVDSLPAVNHQAEFAAACVSEPADRAIHDAAIALAWTAIDLATDEAARERLLGEQTVVAEGAAAPA